MLPVLSQLQKATKNVHLIHQINWLGLGTLIGCYTMDECLEPNIWITNRSIFKSNVRLDRQTLGENHGLPRCMWGGSRTERVRIGARNTHPNPTITSSSSYFYTITTLVANKYNLPSTAPRKPPASHLGRIYSNFSTVQDFYPHA